MTLRDRVENKLERAQAGEIVHFGPLEARLAGFFVEDAMVESDLEGSYEEESL